MHLVNGSQNRTPPSSPAWSNASTGYARQLRRPPEARFRCLELRIDYGPGYRVYYGRDGQSVVILPAGGTKKHQYRDIGQAGHYWKAHKREKRNANRAS